MYFISQTSNPSEFFSSPDYSCETLKNDVSLSESSSSLSSKTDCRDLSLEPFCGSPLHEASNEELVVNLATQTLPELGNKTNCLSEEADTNNDLFAQPLEDQVPSESLEVANNVRIECCNNKLTDENVEGKLENVSSGADNTLGGHPLLRNNLIVLQCPSSDADTSFISPLISVNTAMNDEIGLHNLDLGLDKSLTVVSVNGDPMCMRILCLESELPLSDESLDSAVRSGDPKLSSSSEKKEQVAASGSIMLKHTDVGILSVIPINSVVLGNITFLPQSKPPLKFQVIKQDGGIKSINATKPVLPDVSCDTVPKIEKKSDLNSVENSKPVTEVVLADSEKPYKCELCSTTFNRLGNYTRHKKIHTVPTKEDPRFQCEVCCKKFIQRCDLTRHMHVHSGTEPHRCASCGRGYLRHSDLLTHQRFHNREKPFICPQCTKGFSQKGDLNRHLRSIHLHVKPLTCAHCHKKFAKEATLIRHIQVAHKNISLESVTAWLKLMCS